jgi:hypothetical protein
LQGKKNTTIKKELNFTETKPKNDEIVKNKLPKPSKTNSN